MNTSSPTLSGLDDHLKYLKLSCIADKYAETATKASKDEWSHQYRSARLLLLESYG